MDIEPGKLITAEHWLNFAATEALCRHTGWDGLRSSTICTSQHVTTAEKRTEYEEHRNDGISNHLHSNYFRAFGRRRSHRRPLRERENPVAADAL